MFEKIVGYDYVKEELETIINWYSNPEFLENENANLTNGILFWGSPGNGKTLFIKGLKERFKDNAFVIDGDCENTQKEITKAYKEARSKDLALVLIDEIDLLIADDKKITRVLQDELDGINKSKSRVLTIATTNYYFDLPEALLRSGRFDRIINISDPNEKDRKQIFLSYLDRLSLKAQFKNIDGVIDYLDGLSCAEIMTVCNDCYFRYHGEAIDEEKIRESLSKVDKSGPSLFNEERMKSTAYHEIGHALLTLKYSDDFFIKEVKYIDNGGVCKYGKKEGSFEGFKMTIKEIEIGLGGIAAERIMYNDMSLGSESDLSNVRKKIDYLMTRLPNKVGLLLNKYNRFEREKTEKSKYKSEKAANKMLEKCYKKTYRYLKKHKSELIKYGNMLYEKGYLIKEDFN